MNNLPQLPENTCRYEMYDPTNLQPINDSTIIRLIETGWNQETFIGKTVLDIGCNSGALSIFAAQNGAVHVHSVDVQEKLVSFFSDIVAKHNLPITVEKCSLDGLNPAKNKADVVLCMEVLHWIVDQGGNLSDAIAKLASLTGETLFIETPWDINEPSIKNKPGYPTHEYDIEKIVVELSKHFEDVKFDKFMTYFGDMKDSKRVLLSARYRKVGSLGVRHISDANLSGISLSRGVNDSFIITARKGIKVLKCIPQASTFLALDVAEADRLCDFLAQINGKKIFAQPERLGKNFVQTEADGKSYMLFPFVGKMSDYFPKKQKPKRAGNPLKAVVSFSEIIHKAPESLLESVRSVVAPLPTINISELDDRFRSDLSVSDRLDFIERMNVLINNYSRENENAIIHNDLQIGNFVVDTEGNDLIVDLDLIRTGPSFADLFSCVMYNGLDLRELNSGYRTLEAAIQKSAGHFDVAFASISCLHWLKARSLSEDALSEAGWSQFLAGLDTLIGFEKETLAL